VDELHGESETQQSGHAPRSRPEVKNGRQCQRWRTGEAHMRDNPGGEELNAAECVRRRCKKNSPSVLSRISKSYDRGSEVETIQSG